ncbi:MAG: hypothetical protein M3N00_00335 [Actinomycetota bacterium]|nr:hypothetical protein [Actinomycetota bacterium]
MSRSSAFGGFGRALDAALGGCTEEEKRRISDAFVEERRVAKESGICSVPGCGRLAVHDLFGCAEHRALYDAKAEEEAWDLAIGILRPWVETTRRMGSSELTEVMERALEDAERHLDRALDELEKAEAAP